MKNDDDDDDTDVEILNISPSTSITEHENNSSPPNILRDQSEPSSPGLNASNMLSTNGN